MFETSTLHLRVLHDAAFICVWDIGLYCVGAIGLSCVWDIGLYCEAFTRHTNQETFIHMRVKYRAVLRSFHKTHQPICMRQTKQSVCEMCQAFTRHSNCEALTRHTKTYTQRRPHKDVHTKTFTQRRPHKEVHTNQERPRRMSLRSCHQHLVIKTLLSRRPSDVSLQNSQTLFWKARHTFERQHAPKEPHTLLTRALSLCLCLYGAAFTHARNSPPPSPVPFHTQPHPLHCITHTSTLAEQWGVALPGAGECCELQWGVGGGSGGTGWKSTSHVHPMYIPWEKSTSHVQCTLHSPAHIHSLRPPSLSHTQHSWL